MEIALSALVLVTRTGALTGQMGKGLKSMEIHAKKASILATSELAACGYNHTTMAAEING